MYLEPYQVVRELIAGSLVLINIYLFFSFAGRVKVWRRGQWYKDPAAQAALVLALYFFGALVLRMWDYLLIKLTNLNLQFHYPTAEYLLWMVQNSWWITVAFGAMLIVGGLGSVWVFNSSQRRLGRLIAVALLSIIIPFLLHIAFHGWPE